MAGSAPVFTREEVALATRNHGMPLEVLRADLTPIGLHYVLVHYDIPFLDPGEWRLAVGGRVARPLTLTLDELRRRPQVTVAVTMECAGNGRALADAPAWSQPWMAEGLGTAEWTGTPLAPLLAEAGPADGAVEAVFRGADRGVEGGVPQHYERSLPLAEAMAGDALLAYGCNGRALPPQHGFPVRLVVPGWYGMTNVKWLERIDVVDTPFAGYQMAVAYRWRETEADPGVPLDRIRPRALMVPPGIPDFMTRRRFVPLAPAVLEGRAWSGRGPVTAVEVSVDGGESWSTAALDPPVGRWAWRRWTFAWQPDGPGDRVLCCRATDEAGERQPLAPVANLGGYANNAVQRIPVTVGAQG